MTKMYFLYNYNLIVNANLGYACDKSNFILLQIIILAISNNYNIHNYYNNYNCDFQLYPESLSISIDLLSGFLWTGTLIFSVLSIISVILTSYI